VTSAGRPHASAFDDSNLQNIGERGTSSARAVFKTMRLPQDEEILMKLRSKLVYTALFAASAVAAPAAWAQVQEPAPPAQEYPSPASEAQTPPMNEAPESNTAASATTISDQKIEQFADAYVAVQTIQEKAASDLQTAKEPAQADQVKQKAESDMIAAVEKSGLKVDEFNHIVETMTANADVRERVAAKLQERQGGG
jgi:hypothetical protein